MNMLLRPFRGRRTRSIAALCTVVAAIAFSASSAAAVTLPDTVVGSGSDVMFHVSSALDLLYNESPGCNVIAPSGTQPLDQECIADPNTPDVTTENKNHDVVTENYSIGGGAGVNQICSQGLANVAHVDYARQTSPYSASNCSGLHFVAFARDGVSWEAFPGVTGSATANMHNTAGACAGSSGFCLTQAQLQGIFVTCTITNWSQVGGASAAIKIYTILPQYGTRKFWDLSLGGSSSSCPNVKQIHQTDNSEIAAADLKAAIVPVSFASWTERYKAAPGGSKVGAIDGVLPNLTTIGNGSFPYGRFIYNVFCAGDPTNGNKCGNASAASAATQRYVAEDGWLCKAGTGVHTKDPTTNVAYGTEITNTIKKYGFARLPKGATGGGTTLSNFCRLTTHA